MKTKLEYIGFTRYRRLFVLSALLPLFLPCSLAGRAQRHPQEARDARILLIPLDDRLSSVQFPQMIGQIGETEVIAPPREMLGRFIEPGQPEKITQWVRAQNLRSFDAVIISIDMLAYGGLVNSRVHRTSVNEALDRLQLVSWIHSRAPKVPIYGSGVIMRLAPTAEDKNEAYRDKLARWAAKFPDSAADPALKEEVARLEREIPAAALADYKAARERNLKVNQTTVAMVRGGILDYLILSQDDAQPHGLHVADREHLLAGIHHDHLDAKIAVQPGADEVAMLLLARALNKRFNYSPRVAAIYSSEAMRNRVAAFEDRPLQETVSLQIASTGSREVVDPQHADIVFFVYGSRTEPGVDVVFAEKIAKEVEAHRRQVILADIDTRGSIQGAATDFTVEVRKRGIFPRLAGYAAWNTAGNTIGTALPQGLVYARALRDIKKTPPARRERIASAQIKFLLHRLFDDYVFHSVVRPAAKRFAEENHVNPNSVSGESQRLITNFITERMHPFVEDIWKEFASAESAPNSVFALWGISPKGISNFTLSLPWGRTFEANIDFTIDVDRTHAQREGVGLRKPSASK